MENEGVNTHMFAFKVFFLTPPRFDVIKVAELGNRSPNVDGIRDARVHTRLGSHHVLGRARGDRGDHPRRHERRRPRRSHRSARRRSRRLWRLWRHWSLRLHDNPSWWLWRSRLNSRWMLTWIRSLRWIGGGFRSRSTTFFAHGARILITAVTQRHDPSMECWVFYNSGIVSY